VRGWPSPSTTPTTLFPLLVLPMDRLEAARC
jgi:hypothetical protein